MILSAGVILNLIVFFIFRLFAFLINNLAFLDLETLSALVRRSCDFCKRILGFLLYWIQNFSLDLISNLIHSHSIIIEAGNKFFHSDLIMDIVEIRLMILKEEANWFFTRSDLLIDFMQICLIIVEIKVIWFFWRSYFIMRLIQINIIIFEEETFETFRYLENIAAFLP